MPSMARRILFIAENESSAATRYRALHYFDRLKSAGYEPALAVAGRRRLSWWRLLPAIRQADAVVLLRQLPHWPVPSLVRRAARKLIYDFDDAIYVREDGSPYPRRQRRFDAMVRRCDAVWAGNPELLAAAGRMNRNVLIQPTSVNIDHYNVAAAKPRDTFDLVWIGSSATRKYLEMILPALEQAADELPQLRLKIVADFDLPTKELKTVAVRWTDTGEASALASSHVGLAPLPDNAWTRGKCGLKILQCMAVGLPAIASPVGVQAQMVRPGETGFLAGETTEWIESIRKLATDATLRDEMGSAGRDMVHAIYSEQAVFELMLGSLERLTAGTRH